MRRAMIFMGAVCLVAGMACQGSYRYCLRLRTGNDAQGMAAEECSRDCLRRFGEAGNGYLKCLQACPGATVTKNDRCGPDDVERGRICRVTDEDLQESEAGKLSPGRALFGVAFLAADVALRRGSPSMNPKEYFPTGPNGAPTRAPGTYPGAPVADDAGPGDGGHNDAAAAMPDAGASHDG
jgi:hypothetical protein